MAEAAPQQLRMSGETSPFAAHVALDVVDGVRREVREATVLQVAPEQFHGVEVRCVGWKPDDVAARDEHAASSARARACESVPDPKPG